MCAHKLVFTSLFCTAADVLLHSIMCVNAEPESLRHSAMMVLKMKAVADWALCVLLSRASGHMLPIQMVGFDTGVESASP